SPQSGGNPSRPGPSLRGLWYRNGLGHTGVAGTLGEWLDPTRLNQDYVPKRYHRGPGPIPGHEFRLNLSPENQQALIAFLKDVVDPIPFGGGDYLNSACPIASESAMPPYRRLRTRTYRRRATRDRAAHTHCKVRAPARSAPNTPPDTRTSPAGTSACSR